MILETLKAMAQSKKVMSAAAGVLTLVGVRYLGLPEETLAPLSLQITGVISALLIGQGAADLGKEAKSREAQGIMDAIITQSAVGSDPTKPDAEDLGF